MTEINKYKLKPCPFCVSEAFAYYFDDFKEWTIQCENGSCYCDFRWDKDIDVIVGKWNERHEAKP